MNNTEHLISIVVPIYKVEKYLRRCIDSIISQTYKNFELILVNDGSPDACPQICDEYVARFPNVSVIHQENAGLSAARNAGIEVAKGKYITFIDSDDYVHVKLLEILKNDIDKYKVSVSMCSYIEVNDSIDRSEMTLMSENNVVKIINDQEAMNMLLDKQSTCTAWGKLYAIDLFDNLRFPIGKIMEDMFITPLIFKEAKLIAVDERPLYFYNQEGISIIRSDFNYKKLDMIEATNIWKSNAELYYPELFQKASMHHFSTILNTCLFLANKIDDYGISKYHCFKKEILDNYKQIMSSKFIKRNDKIKVLFMKCGLFRLLVKIKYK